MAAQWETVLKDIVAKAIKFQSVQFPLKYFSVLNNQYSVHKFLSRGGYGDVFKGFDLKEHVNVACKIHGPSSQVRTKTPDLLRMNYELEKEAKPAIMKIVSVNTHPDYGDNIVFKYAATDDKFRCYTNNIAGFE